MKFSELFSTHKPLIACIHLLSLPGSPRYGGSMKKIIETAVREAEIFSKNGIDGLIVENFRELKQKVEKEDNKFDCVFIEVFKWEIEENQIKLINALIDVDF